MPVTRLETPARTLAGTTAVAREALSALRPGPGPRLVVVSLPEPLLEALLGDGLDAVRARCQATWERPVDGLRLLGFGEALRLGGPREEPLAAARPLVRALAAAATTVGVDDDARPRLFGGCRFATGAGGVNDPAWDVFGGWQLHVPRFLVAAREGKVTGNVALLLGGDDSEASLTRQIELELHREASPSRQPAPRLGRHEPSGLDPDEWEKAVAAAVAEIRDGAYLKVVLARQVALSAERPVDAGLVLARLVQRYPNCFAFSFRAGPSTWLGASPELLVSLRNGRVEAACLAGSRPRGSDPDADRLLAHDLLSNEKERAEHGFVVSAIRQALAPVCADLDVPPAPGLMRMPNIQHLHTPIEGRLSNGFDLLDLVERMHPTPAVGGWPRDPALGALARLEQMDRGWYGAPIGWLDLNGEGEFAVALRSARVTGEQATLFAGCGIVAGSVPSEELAETELKFRPLREALRET